MRMLRQQQLRWKGSQVTGVDERVRARWHKKRLGEAQIECARASMGSMAAAYLESLARLLRALVLCLGLDQAIQNLRVGLYSC